MKKIIFLVRHCKAQGQSSSASLTDEGIKQAEYLSSYLQKFPIDTIVSSPYVRAYTSIEPFSTKLHINIIKDYRLSERVLSGTDLPNWRTLLQDTFENLELCLDGGESSNTAMSRGIEVINSLLHSNHSKNSVVVTHGNLLTLILKYYDSNFGFKDWANLSNPDIFRLTFVDQNIQNINRIWN